jgi:hypothetical protein
MDDSSAIEEAARAGIDLVAVYENLRLTPEQRVLKHQAAAGSCARD